MAARREVGGHRRHFQSFQPRIDVRRAAAHLLRRAARLLRLLLQLGDLVARRLIVLVERREPRIKLGEAAVDRREMRIELRQLRVDRLQLRLVARQTPAHMTNILVHRAHIALHLIAQGFARFHCVPPLLYSAIIIARLSSLVYTTLGQRGKLAAAPRTSKKAAAFQWNSSMIRPPMVGIPTMAAFSSGRGARCVHFAPTKAPSIRPKSVWMKMSRSRRPFSM